MAPLDQLLAGLSPRQRDLLLRRLRQQGAPGSDAGGAGDAGAAVVAGMAAAAAASLPPPRRSPAAAAEGLPLSFGQERIWFLDRLDPGQATYNMAAALRLAGRLDAGALRRSLAELVRRHSLLRATFAASPEGGGPVERIAAFPGPAGAAALPLADLAALPAARARRAAADLAAAAGDRPFDLTRGPLVRGLLLRVAAAEHLAVLVVHHIVADGVSMDVLVRELAALYAACRSGGGGAAAAAVLPPLPATFADFAAWQRAQAGGERWRAEMDYWRGELAGAPPLAALPTDRPRPARQSFRGGAIAMRLDAALEAALRAACRRQGATLFMALLGAFEALLVRHGGAEDLVVGTPVAGRVLAETAGLIGPFINSLPLRADLGGDPPFGEIVARARRRALGAFNHQELPFEKVVQELAAERTLAHAPIYQVMLVAQSAASSVLALPELELAPVELPATTAKLDLTLAYRETPGGLELRWLWKRDLFDTASVRRLGCHFEALLAAAVADPALPLSRLPLLTAGEAQQLAEWNDTAADFAPAACLHELVAAQAARRPDLPAVLYDEESLTYGELLGAARRLARRLAAAGVGPEVVVGVCAERSLEMVVGLLAVLLAGGAYLPLDPEYPAERLAFMIAESRAPLVLCQDHLAARLPALPAGARRLSLDGAAAAAGAGEAGGGCRAAGPDNLAYVIYTSGSTGRPKGAMNTHRAIVNRLRWMQEEHRLTAADTVLQKTPFSFDVSVWELFWPLLTGARLVMARPGGHLDSAYLARTILARRVTTLHFVPSMLQVFLGDPAAALCTPLVRIIASGEALPADLAQLCAATLEGAALYNLYGPTEAAVDVTSWPLARGHGRGGGVPIGRPVANTSITLLDRGDSRVPVGVAGELGIGGVQLARGYLARPDLSAERFTPDPVGPPGARLYRTGDLARFLPDGAVEFLGRLDHQVKVRGLRIELGEVEAALAAQPAVREAVVVARAEAGREAIGAVNLVAYVTAADSAAPPGLEEMRAALGRRLPEYMLPGALVVLAALPLTASGKVDRRALPAPRPAAAVRRVAPRNPLEVWLHALWSEMLGTAELGVEDDFFALGGNSITGAIFINRLQEELAEIVHVVALFDAPTVARLAAYLAADYPQAVMRRVGWQGSGGAGDGGGRPPESAAAVDAAAADAEDLAAVRQRIRVLPPWPAGAAAPPRNRRAVFVLSPPRSGSTLLRVMLGGHPRIFAPPELELLGFNTLAERRQAFSGRDRFRLEGLTRAVMEARGCGGEEADALLTGLADEGLPAEAMYGLLQDWIGERLLVDKTPTYAWDAATLRRAEESFAAPLFIHLTRHPYGMIRSFEEARIDQIFLRDSPADAMRLPAARQASRRRLAELLWLLAHDNAMDFLAGLPPERQRRLRFEDLVRDPAGELRRLCELLEMDFVPAMADPYQPGGGRMTDGVHAESRMLGDVKFHAHGAVDAAAAERWREWLDGADFLGGAARALAARLGYEVAPALAVAAVAASTGNAGKGEAGSLQAIPRLGTPPPAPVPLSFSQERLWFLDQLNPGSATYNIPAALRLRGRLDVAALAASLAAVVRRHAVLRTTYAAAGGRPLQVVAAWVPDAAPALPLADLTGGGGLAGGFPAAAAGPSAAALAAEAARRVQAEAERPFDLARGPMLRALLLRLGPEEHVAVLTMHHIASDGWSMGVLLREVAALYGAAREGRPSPLPAPDLQFADFAVWQRGWLAGGRQQDEIGYWRERLAGVPALDLPSDRPRPAVQTFRGGSRGVTIGRPAAAALAELSRRLGATLFMTALSAFMALLARYSGQLDIAVGTPHAGRDRRELEGLVGFFVNTLVVRADLDGVGGFAALAGRVRAAALGAFGHHQVPFEKVVEELQPQRDLARPPLFQVMFILQNAPQDALALPGLAVALEPFPATTAKFELTLALGESGGELHGTLEHNRDLFDPATAERLAGHFAALLAAAAAAPEAPLGDLPMLSAAQRWQLLGEWNDVASVASVADVAAVADVASVADAAGIEDGAAAAELGGAAETAGIADVASSGEGSARPLRPLRSLRSLRPLRPLRLAAGGGPPILAHELFAAQAAAHPGALAVTQGEAGLTYAELAAAANRLARRLRRLGAGPESLVGLLVERGPEMVVAVLAVLEAGAAYVPLDAAHPAERLAMVAADSGFGLLITHRRPWERLGEGLAAAAGGLLHAVVLDDAAERAALAAEEAGPLGLRVEPDSLAYVIYTSGSTGRPKGVQVAHGGLANLLRAMAERPGPGAAGVMAALTTLAFDIAGLEIFLPLAAGARIEVMTAEEASDGGLLAARMAACGATHVQATPASWRLLLAAGWQGRPGLVALCGGEALPWDLARDLTARGLELWNLYGPTETTVWSAGRRVRARAPGSGSVPFGGPLANTLLVVADAAGRPAPPGAAGELLIGGAGVARGYLGRADLTAARFVPDAYGGAAGGRLYRTGDLVRWRPEGDLEFVGRIDTQVKVRGFRIELGEIEAALRALPGVGEAVAVAQGDGEQRRLIAYLVAPAVDSAGEPVAVPPARQLREALLGRLPDYMVPAAFVTLPRLPLTPTGKVDRRALPAPAADALGDGFGGLAVGEHVAPRGPAEELLAAIWSQVLHVERVGAGDNFFALGGHSLLATQVASRVRDAFGVELPLARLFAAPTVAALAREVEAARAARDGVVLPAVTPQPRRGPVALSFAQERMWFLQQLDRGAAAYNLETAVRLAGRLDAAVLARAFAEVVRRHEALRTTFVQSGGQPEQLVQPAAAVPLPLIDLAALPAAAGAAEARRLVAVLGGLPYDLQRGPLLRAALLGLGGGDHVLALGLHHICADGWSIGILVRELAALYAAGAAGEPSPLAELPVQYADFALWQRRVLSGEMLERELAYWRRQLAGSAGAVLLPADRRRAAAVGFTVEARDLALPAPLAAALHRLSRQCSASLYMTLLAAWKALLLRSTGQRDLLVGAPIAGRNRVETEGLIGFFLNTVLLRTEVAAADDFTALLGKVRETCLGAFSHQDLPLEMVLQGALPERTGKREAPFQVMFLLQNLARLELAVAGLVFSPFERGERREVLGTAIFEMGLTLGEAAEADGGLVVTATYNGALFDAATAERLLGRYAALLEAVAADPGRWLWDYPLLAAGEERQLLAAGGAAPGARGGDGKAGATVAPLVHAAFARRAAMQPAATAVVAGARRLTYGELDRGANQLAHHLLALGFGAERVAALAFERSPEMVVAMLAVLKAGGAYVPLDPAYPPERLAHILEDAGAALVITTRPLLARVPALAAGGRVRVVCLAGGDGGDGGDMADGPAAGDAAAIAARPATDPGDSGVAVDGEALAYVIYTSGSTGRPKGVMVRHASLAAYAASLCAEHALGPADKVLQFAALSFDTSAEEIYPCLASGATLVLRDETVLAGAAELMARCDSWGITVLDLPTAFWHTLVGGRRDSGRALPASLRLVILGGERALPERLAEWHAWAGDRVRLVNTYGPTETTIVATRAHLPAGRAPAGEVPIGTPVAGASAYVLDGAGRLAPDGLPGELYIGGGGVARGYLGRTDLTAERFLPDPWSAQPGGRMYRTGDLARWLPDRQLEFLGRTDEQVKIRGYRVELHEIEAALAAHPAVGAAVVLAREDGAPGERRLVAYWTPAGDLAGHAGHAGHAGGVAAPQAADLRGFLKSRLPEHMLPAAWVEMAALPLTPSGKIDRRALPPPGRTGGATAAYEAPRDATEETVAAVWADVLGRERVGVHDNFFELGGHSLLIPQVLYRLEEAFGIAVPLRSLFDEQTVEDLAMAIEEMLLDEIERQDGGAGGPAGAAHGIEDR